MRGPCGGLTGGLGYYAETLERYLDLKYPIPLDVKRSLALTLFGFCTSTLARADADVTAAALKCLTKIIKKKNISGLVLPWRPLYQTLLDYVSDGWPSTGAARAWRAPSKLHGLVLKRLAAAAAKSRFYFSKDATAEITKELTPLLDCPSNRKYFLAQAFLCLLLPVKHGAEAVRTWIRRVWDASRFIGSCGASRSMWWSLFARVAKHTPGSAEILAPYLSTLFTDFFQSLSLGGYKGPCARASRESFPHSLQWLAGDRRPAERPMAKIIVYTLHSKITRDLIANFFQLTRTHFHPTNVGAHLRSLSVFLASLGAYYAKRFGRQERGQGGDSKDNLDPKDTFFPDVAMPAARSAMYSKFPGMVHAALSFATRVGAIHKNKVLGPLGAEWVPSLKNVSQPHRTMCALAGFANLAEYFFDRRVYPQGASQLEGLLWLALPGIDPVDLRKTGVTLTLYTGLFESIPLIDARTFQGDSSASQDMEDDAFDDDGAQRATMCFEEWTQAFLERILEFVKQQERYAEDNYAARGARIMIHRCTRAFFQAMSAPLLNACIATLAKEVPTGEFWDVSPYTAVLLQTVAAADGAGALKAVFPKLFNRIMAETDQASGDAQCYSEGGKTWTRYKGASTAETHHCLYLLSKLVGRAGPALIPYLPRVRAAFAVLGAKNEKGSDDEAKVRRLARKLARNALRSLTLVYPSERKGANPELWNDGKWTHWRSWGAYGPEKDLKIKWHIPTQGEAEEAAKLAQFVLAPALKTLSALGTEQAADSKRRDAVREAIETIECVTRGVSMLLGPFGDRQRDAKDAKSDGRAPGFAPAPVGHTLRADSKSGDGVQVHASRAGDTSNASPTLRFFLGQALIDASEKLMCDDEQARGGPGGSQPTKKRKVEKSSPTNGESIARSNSGGTTSNAARLEALARCIGRLLSLQSVGPMKIQRGMASITRERRANRELWNSKKCTFRPLNVSFAYILTLSRISFSNNMAQYIGAPSPTVAKLVNALTQLTVNDFAKVRAAAVQGLRYCGAALGRPEVAKATLSSLCSVLSSPKTTKEKMLGATGTLTLQFIDESIFQNFSNMSMVFDAVFSPACRAHKEDEVQAAVTRALTFLVANVAAPESDSKAIAGDIKSSAENNATTVLVSLAKRVADEDGLHWRLRLTAAALMTTLMLQCEMYPQEAVLALAGGLISDNFAMRKMSLAGISALLSSATERTNATDTPSTIASSLTALGEKPIQEIKSKAEWDGIGSATDLKCSLSQNTRDALGAFLEKNFSAIMNTALVENHPELSPGAAGRADRRGAGTQLLGLACARLPPTHPYPFARFRRELNAFRIYHVTILARSIGLFPKLAGQASDLAATLAAAEEKDKQCTAAEAVAALVEWALDGDWTRAQRVRGVVKPIIETVLNKGTQDTISIWTQSVRVACAAGRGDPRRVAWLANTVLQWPFDTGTGSDQPRAVNWFRHLSYIRGPLKELVTAAPCMGLWLVKRISDQGLAHHEYKQVREAVGSLLYLVHMGSLVTTDVRKALVTVVAGIANQQQVLLKAGQTTDGKSSDGDAKRGVSPVVASTRALETTMNWMAIVLANGAETVARDIFFPLLPGIFELMKSPDVEVSKLAKNIGSGLAWSNWAVEWPAAQSGAKCCAATAVLPLLRSVAKAGSWHVKQFVAAALAILVPRHAFVISNASSARAQQGSDDPPPALKTVKATLVNMLSDTQVEVREAAARALQSMLTSIPGSGGSAGGVSKMTAKMMKKLHRLAKSDFQRSTKGLDAAAREGRQKAVAKRHGGVLGLGALVLSQPYDVPEWLPNTLVSLAPNTQDPMPVGASAKKIFQEFRRTHRDEWHIFKNKFDEEQLDIINDCTESLSYFA